MAAAAAVMPSSSSAASSSSSSTTPPPPPLLLAVSSSSPPPPSLPPPPSSYSDLPPPHEDGDDEDEDDSLGGAAGCCGDIDLLLAESGYRVRACDLPGLAQRIEQLESLLCSADAPPPSPPPPPPPSSSHPPAAANASVHIDVPPLASKPSPACLLPSDAVLYNPSDMAACLHSLFHELHPSASATTTHEEEEKEEGHRFQAHLPPDSPAVPPPPCLHHPFPSDSSSSSSSSCSCSSSTLLLVAGPHRYRANSPSPLLASSDAAAPTLPSAALPRFLDEEYRVAEDGASSNQLHVVSAADAWEAHPQQQQQQQSSVSSSADSPRELHAQPHNPGSAEATERTGEGDAQTTTYKRSRLQKHNGAAPTEAKRSRAASPISSLINMQQASTDGGVGVSASALIQSPVVYDGDEGDDDETAEDGANQASGIELVHLLTACADAIQKQELGVASKMVREIWRRLASAADGGGAMFKVATHFAGALDARIRLFRGEGGAAAERHCRPDFLFAHFYETCPYLKFSHFMANQAILQAFRGHRHVHVLDLDLKQGFQWPALIQALALRDEGPPVLRITAIAGHAHPSDSLLRDVGHKLADIATAFNLRFSFQVAESLDLVRLLPAEALAVNSIFQLHRLLRDRGGAGESPIDLFLASIRKLNPKVVTVAEQEANHNSPVFLERFAEALYYYCTMFDSLEEEEQEQEASAGMGREWAELHLGMEIMDIVAMEGEARVERHEMLWQWRRRLLRAGFKPLHLGSDAFTQARLLLSLRSKHGFTVQENAGCLTLGWHSRPLLSASAWQCCHAL